MVCSSLTVILTLAQVDAYANLGGFADCRIFAGGDFFLQRFLTKEMAEMRCFFVALYECMNVFVYIRYKGVLHGARKKAEGLALSFPCILFKISILYTKQKKSECFQALTRISAILFSYKASYNRPNVGKFSYTEAKNSPKRSKIVGCSGSPAPSGITQKPAGNHPLVVWWLLSASTLDGLRIVW